MTGSLQTKNGKYYAVINLIDVNGKRKQKWISTGYEIKGNKKKAEQFLRDTLKEFDPKKVKSVTYTEGDITTFAVPVKADKGYTLKVTGKYNNKTGDFVDA